MLSDPAKKAADAERQRKYRARKKAAKEAEAAEQRDASASRKPLPKPVIMRDEVEAALAAMKWLEASDGALVALARQCASQLDSMGSGSDIRLVTRIFQVQQTLVRVLHELGGTPTVRMQHELRSLRLRPTANPEGTHADDDEKRGPGGASG
jgi:hypothetical protein